MNWLIATGVIMLLVWTAREYFVIKVEANTAMLVMSWRGRTKVLSQGLNIIWPWESVVLNGIIPLVTTHDSFTGDFETKDESTVPLKFSFNRKPSATQLKRYIEFNPEKRREGIVERLKGMASIRIRACKDRDEAMDKMKSIAKDVEDEFRKTESENHTFLEAYFGEIIEQLAISDPGLPEALKDAQTKHEAQKKENETRKSEMENIKKMAAALVTESEKRGSKMSFEKATEIIQVQMGKVKKDIKIFGLDRGTQDAVDKIVMGVMGNGK